MLAILKCTHDIFRYGDVTPKTVVGRIVGAICAVTGTLVIALPVPIVSENFSLFYKQERRRRMVQERRAALEKAHMEGKVVDYEVRFLSNLCIPLYTGCPKKNVHLGDA